MYDDLKIYVLPFLKAALQQPELDIDQEIENRWNIFMGLIKNPDRKLKLEE